MSDILFTSDVIKEAQNNGYTGIQFPEGYDQTAVPFRPVKCTEAALQSTEPVEGYVYFTIDTKKIYYGHNGKFLGMGGNSGFYYGSHVIQDTELDYIIFNVEDDIEGDVLPNVDDLVINVGGNQYDGFYRVVEQISDTEVHVVQLPVGGGGGGGGTGSSNGSVRIVKITSSNVTTLPNEEVVIRYRVEAVDMNGDPVDAPGRAIWRVNNIVVEQQNSFMPGEHEFKVDQYLDVARGANTVGLTVFMDTGGAYEAQASTRWTVNVVNLVLNWPYTYGPNSYITSDTFSISWSVSGMVSGMTNTSVTGNSGCDTHIIFDNGTHYTYPVSIQQNNNAQTRAFDRLSHGVHIVEMYLTTSISGMYIETAHQFNQIICIEPTNPNVIISIPFFQQHVIQYDTLDIPFLVYQPGQDQVSVDLLVNGIRQTTETCGRDLQHWRYTVGVSGTVTLAVRVGNVQEQIEIIVDEFQLPVAEPSGYKFSLKPSQFSGQQQLRDWEEGGVTLSFSENFDWVNGGLQIETDTTTGSEIPCIVVKHNTTMTINYNLFANRAEQNGKSFKFIFKASNCYDYEAPVLSCYNNNIGLRINAQAATLTTTSQSMVTNFFEDQYIELETDVWRNDPSDTGERYIMFWIDGVPTSVRTYLNNDAGLTQNSPVPITIGSTDCDVYVYLVKVYERTLSKEEHINNFIVDAPNKSEIMQRFNRNDILDNNGEISPYKLAEKNPDCQVHLYEIDRMTVSKKDPVDNCHYEQYNNGNGEIPALTADNVTIKVQGTSSAYYGVAAYNIDSDFKGGFDTADGQHIDSWAMTDNSIPVNYFCTKVNVASCENSNNAINAQFYNDLQPYWDKHRRDNPKARDCMEFHPGVMFVKDHNQRTTEQQYTDNNVFLDTPGYMTNPYYKQYAICNMGNSKKNVEVFHDTTNPLCCCVEVLDNQTQQQMMTTTEGITPECFENDSEWFEFRYPDGNDAATLQMKQAWCDFVKWMAESNPNAATNAPLPEPVTFGNYRYGSKDGSVYNRGSGRATIFNAVETAYAKQYTTDSKEYRIAKMLNECEDHLVMDSVVFHYIFIERHTMVDNVAKNTFWSTEDLKHWDLTKNYDNDTSDGNDNSGMLSFTYGLECLDTREGSDRENVFNASGSVWLNFIDALPVARQTMYSGLVQYTQQQWTARSYLQAHKDFQDCIPERCWVEDYFRKYLRPRRIGQDPGGSYISRLEGGKKAHQREQYENYQQFYLDTKYRANTAANSFIQMRAQKGDSDDITQPEDAYLEVSMYVNCYLWNAVGGQNNFTTNRVKRKEVSRIGVEGVENFVDSTVYIYGARYVQTLERLAILHPQLYQGESADKLRVLDLGSIDGKYYNKNLFTLSMSSSGLLEELNLEDVNNTTAQGAVSELDFQSNNGQSLKKINLHNSQIKSVTFAQGGLLETAKLSNLQVLHMIDLTKLQKVTFDEGIGENLNTLDVQNCPVVDTKSLIQQVIDAGRTDLYYKLTNINWTITDNSLDGRQLNKIDILEPFLPNDVYDPDAGWYLNKFRPLGYAAGDTINTPAISLTGTITIDQSCDVNEFDIYFKYTKNFPNLEIKYTDKVTLVKAPHITFMENDLPDSPVLYSVLADGKKTIGELTSNEGPSGIAMSSPHKERDNRYIYQWNNSDTVQQDDLDWYEQGKDAAQGMTHKAVMALVPDHDITFIPIFTEIPRRYNVHLLKWDGTPVTDDIDGINTKTYSYEQRVNLPLYLYRQHTDSQNYKYTLRGWMEPTEYQRWFANNGYVPNLVPKDTLGNESITISRDDQTYYTYYVEEPINTPTRDDLFEFTPITIPTYIDTDGSTKTFTNTQTGYRISMTGNKSIYKSQFKDVLCLPNKHTSGDRTQDIVSIGDFHDMPYLQKVMFEDNETCNCVEIATVSGNSVGAFSNTSYETGSTLLQEVILPPSLRTIGIRAFYHQTNLSNINITDNITQILTSAFQGVDESHPMQIQLSKLPAHLYTLGSYAFSDGGNGVAINELPETLSELSTQAFAYCKNVNITHFGTDGENGLGLKSIQTNAVIEGGTGILDGVVWIGKSVQTLSAPPSQPFRYYGNDVVKTVHYGRSEEFYKSLLGIEEGTTVSAALGFISVEEEDFET